ncbi:MAG: putative drug exporter of the superfamily [Solirubrobacterales bacterium]|jgi:RND superfamily putative drug exporter|nr:putative drug exporter of the superfamily [Solirubrobacterales bacterium]
MDAGPVRGSLFTFAAGRRSKWIVFAIWFVVIFVAAGPANLPGKFEDAESNEATSYLPGDAESTHALKATESLQNGEIAPAVIVFRRDSSLTSADRQTILADVRKMTAKRFPGVIPDGATAAAGGKPRASAPAEEKGLPSKCGGPTTTVPGQPPDYAPFVGPTCSKDGKAAIVTAYIKGNGEGERIVDPVKYWRDQISSEEGGLEVKITGGAGFSADAIEVFEGINGTLLLAALSLVIFLLIVIYRSPMFFLIPLVAVMFAELLSRSLGYGLTELGVTVNGQSSSIMSVLVLGAGTDYALLLVSRYREELHHTVDKHEAMRTALASAGPAIFASAATVIAALFCLMLAKVNGTAGLGPIAAMGIACAALSMLTLLPALLTIFGRRAFWPFVPHTPETAPSADAISERARAKIVEGGAFGAIARIVLACLAVLVLLPLVLVNWLLRRLSGRRIPSLIVGPLDRAVFTPYELRRRRLEHAADATHGFWAKLGERIARSPRRVVVGSIAVLLILCGGFAFFSTELTSEDTYRSEVESVEGQHLLNKSFPAGTTALTDIVVPKRAEVPAVRAAMSKVDGVEAISQPVAEGRPGTLVQATLEPNPYSTDAFDLVEPIRDAVHRASPEALVGGPTAVEFDVRDAAGSDSILIPPLILFVVFLILIGLLRAVVAPLILIGTVILSFLAALGVGYFAFEFIFDFPGSDPSLPLFAFVFLVALGVDYNIFLIARAREETIKHGSKQGILRALAVTGAVITSAGIVLAGTFSVLAVLPLTFLTELGFVVAFGVLLDTFLVRSVLVPALALMVGDKFWWPSDLSKGGGGPAGPEGVREPAGTAQSHTG